MTTRSLSVLFAVFLFGLLVITLDGDTSYFWLTLLTPVVVVGAFLSTVYMALIYRRLDPKPRFFRMLLGAQTAKVMLGVVVAYFALGVLAERERIFFLPNIAIEDRAAFLALMTCILLSPPMYYAFHIWRQRRTAAGIVAQQVEDAEVTAHTDLPVM